MRTLVFVALIGALTTGCVTSFRGSAKVPNGPSGCQQVCDTWGMELAGMVQMGEYSNGCICQVRGKTTTGQLDIGAVGPAVVGVMAQSRRAEADQELLRRQREDRELHQQKAKTSTGQ